MDIVIEGKYQSNLQTLIELLSELPDEKFDMRIPIVTDSGCGCIEAHARNLASNHNCFPLCELLGITLRESDYIVFGDFSDGLLSGITKEEAVEYLKSLRNNSEKG